MHDGIPFALKFFSTTGQAQPVAGSQAWADRAQLAYIYIIPYFRPFVEPTFLWPATFFLGLKHAREKGFILLTLYIIPLFVYFIEPTIFIRQCLERSSETDEIIIFITTHKINLSSRPPRDIFITMHKINLSSRRIRNKLSARVNVRNTI